MCSGSHRAATVGMLGCPCWRELCILDEVSEHLWAVVHIESVDTLLLKTYVYFRLKI